MVIRVVGEAVVDECVGQPVEGDEEEVPPGRRVVTDHLDNPDHAKEGFIQKRRQRSSLLLGGQHKRRIKTEEKAKVVAVAWVDSIPCRASFFAPGLFEE